MLGNSSVFILLYIPRNQHSVLTLSNNRMQPLRFHCRALGGWASPRGTQRLFGSHPNVERRGAFTLTLNPDTPARKAVCLDSSACSKSTCKLPQHKHKTTLPHIPQPATPPPAQPTGAALSFPHETSPIREECRVPSPVTLNKPRPPCILVSPPWLPLPAFLFASCTLAHD